VPTAAAGTRLKWNVLVTKRQGVTRDVPPDALAFGRARQRGAYPRVVGTPTNLVMSQCPLIRATLVSAAMTEVIWRVSLST